MKSVISAARKHDARKEVTPTPLRVGAGIAAAVGVFGVVLTAEAPGDCAALNRLTSPDIKISEATAVAAADTGAIRVAHCHVSGIIGSEIKFTLLLPDAWNGKFFMGGGGGFVGSVQNSASTTVNQGYATVGTDTGHQGGGVDA